MGHKIFVLPANERYILFGAILLVWLVIKGIQVFSSSSSAHLPLGAPRDYGIAGGAICPNCHRPFPLGLASIKFGIGTKLVRCQYCRKWSLVRRASLEDLRAAEAAELAEAQPLQPVREKSEAEKLKSLEDESRFTDQS